MEIKDKFTEEEKIIILSALLHDIGKIGYRACESGNHHDIGENFVKKYFPQISGLIREHGNLSKCFDEDEYKKIKIITLADWISSGEREDIDYNNKQVKTTPLNSVFSKISKYNNNYSYIPLELKENTDIYPKIKNKNDTESLENINNEFKNRWKNLKNDFDNIKNKISFDTINYILKKHLCFIPSASYVSEPDISLYDHLKTTTAIATCLQKQDTKYLTNTLKLLYPLFLFQNNILRKIKDIEEKEKIQNNLDIILNNQNNFNELKTYLTQNTEKYKSLLDNKKPDELNKILNNINELELDIIKPYFFEKPFLLIEGDISGIQNFIFDSYKKQESDKGGAKQIRGRSLFIHLLTDASVRYVLEKLKLPIFNVLLQSGGHFIILAPKTQKNKDELEKIRKNINEFLYKKFGTLISLVIANQEGTAEDMKNYANFREKLSAKLNQEKNKKFNCIIELINKEPENKGIKEKNICPVCGRNEKQIDDLCVNCNDLRKLGEKVVKKKSDKRDLFLNIKEAEEENEVDYNFNFRNFNLSYKLNKPDNLNNWKSYLINDTDFIDKSNCCGFMFFGNYVPLIKDNKIATFKHLSSVQKNAFEIEDDEKLNENKLSKIAILKADIDNLGYIFAYGLDEELKTVSRVSTMSFMLDLFFSVEINKLAKKKDIYIIFAGGDDLIAIGRFDNIVKFAKELKENFDKWVCNNPEIHFSAGIVMASNKFPVKRLIKYGEDALENSKKGDKNKITILNKTMDFDKYEKMIKLFNDLNKTENISESAIYNLIQIENQKPKEDDDECKLKKGTCIIPNTDPYIKYSVFRNYKGDNRDAFIKELINASKDDYLKTSVGLHSLHRRYFGDNKKSDKNEKKLEK